MNRLLQEQQPWRYPREAPNMDAKWNKRLNERLYRADAKRGLIWKNGEPIFVGQNKPGKVLTAARSVVQ